MMTTTEHDNAENTTEHDNIDIMPNREEVVPKRKAGRPKGSKNLKNDARRVEVTNTDTEKPRKAGRPPIYEPQYDENNEKIRMSVITYRRRGYLLNRIRELKTKLYGKAKSPSTPNCADHSVLFPTREDYINVSNEIVAGLLQKLMLQVMEMKSKNLEIQIESMNKGATQIIRLPKTK
jgi:hypothetical protein